MGRKVFISVLGTGFYEECTYVGSRRKTGTKFIQAATLNDIGADAWTENDAIYVFLTDKAREANWTVESRENRNKEMVPYFGLEKELDGMGLKCHVFPVGIKDGKDEAEMWEVFETIYKCLEDGDELYFDLTHAFRYLPMLVLVLGGYARFMKNTRVADMSYGNYEARNRENNEAPIVDLLPLAMLQDWTSAASAFKEMGRVGELVKVLGNELRNQTYPAGVQSSFRNLSKNLALFEGQMLTCRGKELVAGKEAVAVKNLRKTVSKNSQLPLPLKDIVLSAVDTLSGFGSGTTENIVEALRWCRRYHVVQQGYTLCQEGIVTWLCERFKSVAPRGKMKNYRELWSSILGIDEDSMRNESVWRGPLAENRDLARVVLAQDWLPEIRSVYKDLTDSRNTVNHGGFTSDKSGTDLMTEFDGVIDRCLPLFEIIMNLPDLPEVSNGVSLPGVFINYTNHPSGSWGEKQKEAAGRYGHVVDVQFPIIEPDMNEGDIETLAETEFQKILKLVDGKDATVHIMGEQTLAFVLINKLKTHGIRCVASTSARVVKELDDKTRVVEFNFVRFREY